MTERFGELNSDQEDMVGTSSELDDDDEDDLDDYYDDDEDEDDVSINDEEIMRYALANAKTQNYPLTSQQDNMQNPIETTDNVNENHLNTSCVNCSTAHYDGSCNDEERVAERYNSTEKLIMESNLFESKTRLFGNGIVLLMTTFAILVLLPLYFQQLSLNGERFNVFGATFLLSCNANLIFLFVAMAFGVVVKWKVPIHKPPLKWTQLIIISFCYGLAVILFSISSADKRVPCHLQDPLKGASLVFSLVFYFFFCRKVMGLQRIFSATTTVVGLFIAVDYGLCDEFRCRGTDLTGEFLQTGFLAITSSKGWQARAIWTLMYVAGIGLWALHISLLEGALIQPTKERQIFTFKPMNLLRTVSKIVSSAETTLPTVVKTPTKEPIKQPPTPPSAACGEDSKPHSIHLIVWIHALSFIFITLFGWIDIFPVQGATKSLSRHFSDTENTILCHFNVYNRVPEVRSNKNQEELDFLSNLIPGSSLSYNKTVQKRRRARRSAPSEGQSPSSERKPEEHRLEITHFNYTMHRINTETKRHHYHNNKSNSLHNNNSSRVVSSSGHGSNKKQFKPMSVLSGFTEEPNPLITNKVSHYVMKSEVTGNCARVQIYALVLLLVYIVFVVSLVNFLLISESAVFTMCVVTAALPLVGIFWSMFEINIEQQTTIVLIWSPEISGELICSLLGTPIVFLGIGLLCRAYFTEQIALMGDHITNQNILPVSFENSYYTTCFENGVTNSNLIEIDDNESYNRRNIISNENGNSF